ncbi:MAG: phosphate/phosphite/phosphonate ABC transporter substrate-binding protein, partial [Myxococcota bacterium]
MPYVRAVAWALTLLQSSTGSAATVEEVRVAVRAPLRAEAAEHQWERMEDYLQAEVGHPVRIETLGPEALTHAIERETHDFFITNPVIYAHHEQSRALTRVATLLRTGPRGEPLDRFAGLLVVRRDRDDLHSSKDLTGATLGAVGPLGLGGYLMQRRYLLSLGIDTERDMSTIFLGVPQRRIVSAVLEGRADVGAVRTGVLEAMIARGELDGDELRVLDALPASPELPYIHTTRAYPEFALAIGPKVPTELARRVAAAFMRLPGDHPAAQATGVAGWTLPGEYSEVHELLRELRLGPYADFGRFTLGDVLRQYLGFVLAGFVMFMAILALTGYALLAQRRVAARNESLALVLDNIGQGFVRVRADGTVHPEVSARARRWLGEQVAGNSMAALLSRVDPEAGARFGLGLGCVFDPIVPIEVAFTQLPQQMTTGDRRVVRFAYRALEGQELLVVL